MIEQKLFPFSIIMGLALSLTLPSCKDEEMVESARPSITDRGINTSFWLSGEYRVARATCQGGKEAGLRDAKIFGSLIFIGETVRFELKRTHKDKDGGEKLEYLEYTYKVADARTFPSSNESGIVLEKQNTGGIIGPELFNQDHPFIIQENVNREDTELDDNRSDYSPYYISIRTEDTDLCGNDSGYGYELELRIEPVNKSTNTSLALGDYKGTIYDPSQKVSGAFGQHEMVLTIHDISNSGFKGSYAIPETGKHGNLTGYVNGTQIDMILYPKYPIKNIEEFAKYWSGKGTVSNDKIQISVTPRGESQETAETIDIRAERN